MARQQEIGNAFFDRVLVPAAPTHQLSIRHTRLHQQLMQIPQRLCRFLCVFFQQILRFWRCFGEGGQAELCIPSAHLFFFSVLPLLLRFFGVKGGRGVGGTQTSPLNCTMAFHSSRGSTFTKNSGFSSISTRSSSASRGCRGKAAGSCLQALRAHVKKLRVKSFIFFFLFAFSGGSVFACESEAFGCVEIGRWVVCAVEV